VTTNEDGQRRRGRRFSRRGTTGPPGGDAAQRLDERAVERELGDLQVAQRNAENARDRAEEAAREADADERALDRAQMTVDADKKRRVWFPIAVFAALLFAVVDVIPAWWAAEALGGDYFETALVTALLVAGLAGFAALVSHFQHTRQWISWRFAVAASVALVVVESWLRFDYLTTTVEDVGLRQALTETGLLALVTGGLLWMSYVVLLRAEQVSIWRMRRQQKRLRKRERALASEAEHAMKAWDQARFAVDSRFETERLLEDLRSRTREVAESGRGPDDSDASEPGPPTGPTDSPGDDQLVEPPPR
jgi:hypothetical protein